MPPLPPIPNVVRVIHHFSIGGDANAIIREHFQYSGGPPSAVDCATIASAARSQYAGHLAALTSNGISMQSTICQDMNSLTGAQGTDNTVVGGGSASPQLSAATCALINHSIARRYRGGKPRTYLPSLGQADLANATNWLNASVNSLTTAYLAYIAGIVGTVAGATTITHHVNVSQYQGFTAVQDPVTLRWRNKPNHRPGGPLVDVITNSAVNVHPGSQRRRNLHGS